MYNVPKRIRRKRQLPKVVLYSATILSVTTTNVLPAASVFAEAQMPKKQDDQNNQPNNVLANPIAAETINNDIQSEQSPQQTSTNDDNDIIYTVLYKDQHGRIVSIDDNLKAVPGDDISKIISNNVSRLSGNWDLAEYNATFTAPSSSTTPIIVEMKPHYDFKINKNTETQEQVQNQEQVNDSIREVDNSSTENNEEKTDSPKQEPTDVTNHLKFVDQNGISINAKNGSSEVTVSGKTGTPIDLNAEIPNGYKLANPGSYSIGDTNDEDLFIIVKSENEVINTVEFTIDGQPIRTINVSGTKGETINLTDWVPSGYTVIENPVFGEDQSTIRVALVKTDNENLVKNTIQFRDPAGNPLGEPFVVYGEVGQKIILGGFLPNGYDLVDSNLSIEESSNTRDVQLKISNVETPTNVTNKVQFTINGENVGNPVEISGTLDENINLSAWIPSGYKLTTTPKFDNSNVTKTIELKKIEDENFVTNKIQLINSNGNVGTPFEVYGHLGDPINFGIFMPDGYTNPIILFDESTSTREINLTVGSTINNDVSFVDENNNVIATNSVTGGLGSSQNVSNLLPENYELVNNNDSLISLEQEGKNHTINIQGKMYKNTVEYIDDATQDVISTQEVSGRYNNLLALNLPNDYIQKNSSETFKIGANESIIKVLVVKNTTHVTNNIQFKFNGIDFGERIQVTGTLGEPIDLSTKIPSGYEIDGDAPIFVEDGSTVQVNIKKITAADENIENTVTFKDQNDNTVGGPHSVTGKKGDQINITSLIPSGYELIDSAPVFDDVTTAHDVKVKLSVPTTATNFVQFTVDGQDKDEPIEVTGNIGSEINLTSIMPKGYELVDKNNPPKIDPNDGKIIKVAIKEIDEAPITVNNTLVFMADGTNVATVTVNGQIGSDIDIASHLPEGYQLTDSSISAKFGVEGTQHNIEVKATEVPAPTPVKVKNSVQFKIDGQNINSPIDVAGNKGENINLNVWIPTGYELEDTPIFGEEGTIQTANLKKIDNPLLIENTIQFTTILRSENDFGDAVKVYGTDGEDINFGIFMPQGYELALLGLKIDSTQPNRSVAIKPMNETPTPSPDQVTNVVKITDANGTVLAQQDFTGAKDSNQNISSLLPENYEWINDNDSTIKLSENSQPIEVQVQGKLYNNKIVFMDEDNSVQIGFQDVNGRYNTNITDILNVPTGYKLKNANVVSTLKIGGNNAEIHVSVIKDEVHVTNNIQFTFEGEDFGTPVTVSGNIGDTIDLSSLIPNGYELIESLTSIQFKADGSTQKVAIKKTSSTDEDIINTIKFKTNNGTVIGNPITITGKTGDVINIASMIPTGYELASPATEYKIGAADTVIEIEIKKISTEVDNYIQFTVDGDDHGSAILVHGEPDSVINLAGKIPSGYELVDPNATVKINATNGKIIKVAIKQTAPTTIDNTLEFVANGTTIYTVTVNGAVGTNIDIANHIPAGYELVNSSTTAKINANNTNHQIAIKKTSNPTPAPVKVKNTVQFKLNGQNINSPIEVTGNTGENINLTTWIPTGYKLESTPKYGNEGAAHIVNLKKIDDALLVENTIQFTTLSRIETNFGSPVKVYGTNGQTINFGIFMPQGYELVIPGIQIDSSHPNRNISIKPLGLTPTPDPNQVTNTIKITDTNGTVLAQRDFTGPKDSNQSISSLLPEHYEWINASDNTVKLTTSGQPIVIMVQGKVYNNKILFVDENNSIQVGTQSVSGRYKTTVTGTLNVPTGYKLKNSNIQSTLKIGANNAELHVAVVKDQNYVTNKIQFTYNGADFGNPVTITGNNGDAVNLTSYIPNGFELLDPSTPTKLGADGTITKVALKKKMVATDVQNTIKFKTVDGTVISTKSITGTPGDIINIATMIPDGYELVNNTVYKISSQNAVINIEIKRPSAKVNNYLQFTVKGNDFGNSIVVNGEPNSTIDVASKVPEGYELVDKNATFKFNPTNGKILKVAIKGVAVKNTVKININGTTIGTFSASGNRFDDLNIDQNLIPSGYKLSSTPKFGVNESTQTVELQKINDPTLIKNTIKVAYPDGTTKTIDVFGKKGDKIKLGILLPSGYTDPQAVFGDDGISQDISLKKNTPSTSATNYVQFTVDGINYGSKVSVTGNVGKTIDLKNIIPKGYELVDKNASALIDAEGTIHKIAIQKIKTDDENSTTNYVQFTVDGKDVGNSHKVKGNIGDVINITNIIPNGYELANFPITIKFTSEGTIHRVELKKSSTSNSETVENSIQFTIDGDDYSIRINRTGKLGDTIDIAPWVPSGYELVDKNTPVKFQANGTVHKIAIKKSVTAPNTSVTNWVQLTVDDVNYGNAIKVTGKTGNAINLSALIPMGYELTDPATTANFGNEGDTFKISIKKSTSKATTVQNYIQFTIDGVDYSIQILRTGKLGDVIDINPWIPDGYELVDKHLTYRFIEDGSVIRIPIRKITAAKSDKNNPSRSSDPATRTAVDPGTTRKQATLPQTGENSAQAAALSALGVTTAGTAALWLNSRRKKSKRMRNIQRSGK